MDTLLSSVEINPLKKEDIVEGIVIRAEKRDLWLDLGIYGTALVVGKEAEMAAKNIKPGDSLSASVIEPEGSEGYAILSLRRAVREKGWEVLEERFKAKEVFGIIPFDANKGGMLIEVEGVRGFLPVSQLSAENYPRVTGADKDEILHRLNQLIGQTLMVRILDLDKAQNKLIVSEKEAQRELTEDKISGLHIGDNVTGIVTGVVDFGVFVSVDGIEGLVHISEIAWDRVDNPSKFVKVGQEISAKIIAIDSDKLSLSMKQLSDDPWAEEAKNYKLGLELEGTVTRITPFGAFVQITPVIEALVHISELSNDHVADPNAILTVGEKKKFRIIAIDADTHKLSLSLKSPEDKSKEESKQEVGSSTSKATKEKTVKSKKQNTEKVENKVKKTTKPTKSKKKD
jgi:small subunit ribosomal protein S1